MFVITIVTTNIDSGGLAGQSPYMTGNSSCSNCPDDKRFCVNNLCTDGELNSIVLLQCMLIFAVQGN